MQVQDLFEAHYAEVHAIEQAYVRDQRMGQDSYRLPSISIGWRMFRAGFEAKEGGLLREMNSKSIKNTPIGVFPEGWEQAWEAGVAMVTSGSEGESGGGVVKMTSSGQRYWAGFDRISHPNFSGRCKACSKVRNSALGKKNAASQQAQVRNLVQPRCDHGADDYCGVCFPFF